MNKENKNKKGFTLIELLAAIVILGVIMTISGVVIMNAIKNSKEKSYKVTVNEVESNANNYLTENSDRLFFLTDNVNNFEYQCVTVQNLVDYGYLKDTITKSKVNDNTNVDKKDYIYIVRNIKTKAIMRKMMTWVMAATLIISGLGVFTACSSSSDDGEKKIGNLTAQLQ